VTLTNQNFISISVSTGYFKNALSICISFNESTIIVTLTVKGSHFIENYRFRVLVIDWLIIFNENFSTL